MNAVTLPAPAEPDVALISLARRDLRELHYSLEFAHDKRFGMAWYDLGEACRSLSRVDPGPLELNYEITELYPEQVLKQLRVIRDVLEREIRFARDQAAITWIGAALHRVSHVITGLVISIARNSAK